MPIAALSSGLQMYYEEHGSGDPLILHYGTGGGHSAWEPQVNGLKPTFRVITPDPRGTGQTGGDASPWTIALLAADLCAFMDALSIERAHLAGMSMGASVLQEFAIRYPERTSTLVLANTWGRTDTRLKLIWEHNLFLAERAALATASEQDRWNQMLYRHVIATFFSSDALANRMGLVEQWWEMYSRGLRPEGSAGHLHAMLGHDALDRLSDISTPTLVLAGEEDYFTSYYPNQVHERIPGSTLVTLSGLGSSHGMLWERSDEANAFIRDFALS
jgi:pimeloyl-ACP methyl ester carboxylesterase